MLGRFDISYATSALSQYNMAPRKGHLKAVLRVMSYLKYFSKGRILLDNSYPDHSVYKIEDHDSWSETYSDTMEEIPSDMPEPKGRHVRLMVFVDADHAHDQVTRRPITGIILFLNNTPIRWVCKRQKTVESSTYGSELVAACIVTKLIMEVQ